jgi:hypothetical protein
MDKCLIRRTLTGRYQTHRLLGQYGRQKLAQGPQEESRTYERYCDYYTRFLQRQMELLSHGGDDSDLSEIAAEQENLKAAWSWAVGGVQPDRGAPAATGAPHQRFVAAKTAFESTGSSPRATAQPADRLM